MSDAKPKLSLKREAGRAFAGLMAILFYLLVVFPGIAFLARAAWELIKWAWQSCGRIFN